MYFSAGARSSAYSECSAQSAHSKGIKTRSGLNSTGMVLSFLGAPGTNADVGQVDVGDRDLPPPLLLKVRLHLLLLTIM